MNASPSPFGVFSPFEIPEQVRLDCEMEQIWATQKHKQRHSKNQTQK
jgi:hypothetical protein